MVYLSKNAGSFHGELLVIIRWYIPIDIRRYLEGCWLNVDMWEVLMFLLICPTKTMMYRNHRPQKGFQIEGKKQQRTAYSVQNTGSCAHHCAVRSFNLHPIQSPVTLRMQSPAEGLEIVRLIPPKPSNAKYRVIFYKIRITYNIITYIYMYYHCIFSCWHMLSGIPNSTAQQSTLWKNSLRTVVSFLGVVGSQTTISGVSRPKTTLSSWNSRLFQEFLSLKNHLLVIMAIAGRCWKITQWLLIFPSKPPFTDIHRSFSHEQTSTSTGFSPSKPPQKRPRRSVR